MGVAPCKEAVRNESGENYACPHDPPEGARYAGSSEQETQAARRERVQDFFQEIIDEGVRIEEPWDVKNWIANVALAIRPLLDDADINDFWNFLGKDQTPTLDDRDRCLSWFKAIRLKYWWTEYAASKYVPAIRELRGVLPDRDSGRAIRLRVQRSGSQAAA